MVTAKHGKSRQSSDKNRQFASIAQDLLAKADKKLFN
jgi:hypothetical protein